MATVDKNSPPLWWVFDELVNPETSRRDDTPGVEKVFHVHVVRVGGGEPDHTLSPDCFCAPHRQNYKGGNSVFTHNALQ